MRRVMVLLLAVGVVLAGLTVAEAPVAEAAARKATAIRGFALPDSVKPGVVVRDGFQVTGPKRRPVVLQHRAPGQRWQTVQRARTTSKRQAQVRVQVVRSGGRWVWKARLQNKPWVTVARTSSTAHEFRIQAPRKKRFKAAVSNTERVRVNTPPPASVPVDSVVEEWATFGPAVVAPGDAVLSGRVRTGVGYKARAIVVQRKPEGSDLWTDVADSRTGSDGRFVLDVFVPSAGRWLMRVIAPAAEGVGSAVSDVRLVEAGERAGVPLRVSATPGDGEAAVVWAAPPGPAPAGFVVQTATSAVGPWADAGPTVTEPVYRVTGLTNGAVVFLTVVSVDAAGIRSGRADPIAVVPVAVPEVDAEPAPGVREIATTDVQSAVDLDTDRVQVTLAQRTSVGELLAVEPGPDLPRGLLAQVVSAGDHASGGTVAVVELVALADVYPDQRLDFESEPVLQPLISDDPREFRVDSAGTFATFALSGDPFTCQRSAGGAASASELWETVNALPISFTLEYPKIIQYFDAGAPWRKPSLLFQFSGEVVSEISFRAKAAFSCQLDPAWADQHALVSKVAMIGKIPAYLDIRPAFEFEVGATGAVSVSQRQYFAYTFDKPRDQPFEFRRSGSHDPAQVDITLQGGASVFGGADAGIGFGLGKGGVDAKAGVYGKLGPEVNLTYTLPSGCARLGGSGVFDGGIRLQAWVKEWDYQVTEARVEFGALWESDGCRPTPPDDATLDYIARDPSTGRAVRVVDDTVFDIPDGGTFLCLAQTRVVWDYANHPALAQSPVGDTGCDNAERTNWDARPDIQGGNVGTDVILRRPDGAASLINSTGEIQAIADGGTYLCLARHRPVIWDVATDAVEAWRPVGEAPAECTFTPPQVGQLRVGMTIDEAVATGEATYVPADGTLPHSLAASDPGIYICLDRSDDAIGSFIVKDGNPWSTPEGIGPGSTAKQVRVAYPSARIVELGSTFMLVDYGHWGYQFYIADEVVDTIGFGEEIGTDVMFHC